MKETMRAGRRILLGAGVPAAALFALVYLRAGGELPNCLFHSLTGLYCPGCGSGRAVTALLYGRLREAFFQNILLFPLGIPACVVLLHEYLRLVFPGLGLRPVRIPRAVGIVCAAAILAFWVLRNIPALSFLAPGP